VNISPFELERWQSLWEHRVELNVAESGVEPLSVGELLDVAGLRGLNDVQLMYPQTNGSEPLRERIAALYPGARADNVLVTCGCAEANFLATWSLLERGDEIVCIQPNYLQIVGLARGFGATVRAWWLHEETRWQPDPDELRGLINERTRAIAVCNPNNPTGAVLSQQAVEAVCAVADKNGLHVIADEVYRGAELAGDSTPSFWGRVDRALCTAGLSKAYGLPGLRIGWVVGPTKTIERLWSYHDYTSISPSALGDHLATAALEPACRARILARTRQILLDNHPIIRDWVERSRGSIRYVPPTAGAVAWIAHSGIERSEPFARALLERKGVLVAPAEQFAMEGHLRIGFGGEAATLERALGRIDELLAEGL
jgi:aspartate/methionine/tyrosine aminotransferase